MKSAAERGPFGSWLVRHRKARPGAGRDGSMTAAQARESLMRETGYGISASVWAELEAGTRLPSDEQRQKLEAWAGGRSPQGDHGDLSAFVASVDRLREAIEVLTQAMTTEMVPVSSVREVLRGLYDSGLLLTPPPDTAPNSARRPSDAP